MPSEPLSFTLLTEAASAREAFADLVRHEPEALSMVASVVDALLADPSRYDAPRWWAGIDDAGAVVAAFMHTPPHPLHIARPGPADARALASRLADGRDVLPGVGGLRGPAEAFADEWVSRTGATATVRMEIGRFDLPVRPRLPFNVPGAFRTATSADAALLDEWHQHFHLAIEGPAARAMPLDEHVSAGLVGLWVD